MSCIPLPARQEAVARVRAGTIITPHQIVERYGVNDTTAREWLREGRGEPGRMRNDRNPQPTTPTLYRCDTCLQMSPTPVCPRGHTINPILAKEYCHG